MSPDQLNLTDVRLANPSNTLNKYIFAADNPFRYIDPDGQDIVALFEPPDLLKGSEGHFMLFAQNPRTGESATMSFGEIDNHGWGLVMTGVGGTMPSTDKYGLPMTADQLRANFAALTREHNDWVGTYYYEGPDAPGTTITVTGNPPDTPTIGCQDTLAGCGIPTDPGQPGTESGSAGGSSQRMSALQACGPAPGHPSMGVSGSASTVNPFTSGNGGIWGGNRQSLGSLTGGYTSNNYTYTGKGFGLDIGASGQSVWAWGSGSWTGPFHSINVSYGPFSGSVFWTPGNGGWMGFSFGLGVSPPIPQAAYEVTNYTCKSGRG